jgi:hypothetical protein
MQLRGIVSRSGVEKKLGRVCRMMRSWPRKNVPCCAVIVDRQQRLKCSRGVPLKPLRI